MTMENWFVVKSRSGKHKEFGYPIGEILVQSREKIDSAIKNHDIHDPVIIPYLEYQQGGRSVNNSLQKCEICGKDEPSKDGMFTFPFQGKIIYSCHECGKDLSSILTKIVDETIENYMFTKYCNKTRRS
jgi:hypothetical protein